MSSLDERERATVESRLVERRQQLDRMSQSGPGTEVQRLQTQVDEALRRLDDGTYGLCKSCHDPVEKERLTHNPLCCFCLDHLPPGERDALEDDLVLASRIQSTLLPQPVLGSAAWESYYHYKPRGPVSGDYCDLITGRNGEVLFLLGDVSGKGVAASLLVSQLHAMFRTLATLGLGVPQMVEHANRLFAETVLPSHFATLVCGAAKATGQVEICIAGHCPPVITGEKGQRRLDPTGVPLGLFCDSRYSSHEMQLDPGDAIVLYTDGLLEAARNEKDYGEDRLAAALSSTRGRSAKDTVNVLLNDLESFMQDASLHDDLTVLVLRRV